MRLAVGQVDTGEGPKWRAGGILPQNIAEDDARGATADAWTEAQFLFETVGEDELVDPTLTPETLLYRLFHERGVRLFPAQPLKAFCRCNEERIVAVLKSFGAGERADMVEPDGRIHVTCEYCSRVYAVEPQAVALTPPFSPCAGGEGGRKRLASGRGVNSGIAGKAPHRRRASCSAEPDRRRARCGTRLRRSMTSLGVKVGPSPRSSAAPSPPRCGSNEPLCG